MLRFPVSARTARLSLLCGLAVASGASALAQASLLQTPLDDKTFVTRQWHTGNALPQNTINAVVQSRDGWLWIATLGGLCAFDGERMRVFDPVTAPPLTCSRFTSLCEADDGTLWIGTDADGVFSHRDGRFTHHPEVPCRVVVGMAESIDGRLFVATDGGTFVRESGVFTRVTDARIDRVNMLQTARSGALYAGTSEMLYRCDPDGPTPIAPCNAVCVAEVRDRLLVGTHDGLFCVESGKLEPWRPAVGLDEHVLALCLARDGALWVGTLTRVHRIASTDLVAKDATEPAMRMIPLRNPRATQAIRSLCEDREGGMWVGSTQRGLVQYSRADVAAYGSTSGLPQGNFASVADDGRGGLLLTTVDGLFRKQGARFERDPALDPMAPLRTMLVDPDDTQWIVGETGLVRRDATGLSVVVSTRDWPTHRVVALTRGPDDALWLGGDGLARFDGSSLVVPPVAERFRHRSVRTIAFGSDGAMWVGCTDGLARIDLAEDSVREWWAGSELPFGQVRAVLPEAGERAWIATYGGGVVRIDGARCVSVDQRHGMQDQHLCGMAELGDEFLLASNSGLSLVKRAELAAVANGASANFASRVLGAPGGGPSEMHGGYQGSIATVDGITWVVGIEALYELDPARLTPPVRDLPTHVHEIVVGDRRLPPAAEVTPPVGIRSLTVQLGACTFQAGARVRYRWRLKGVQDEWSQPTYDRDVRLVDLPPGDHLFEASTLDTDGRPALRSVHLLVHVLPQWWEAVWFQPTVILGALAIAVLLVRFGARRAAARAAQLERLVEERTRELVAAQQHLEQRVADRTEELSTALARQESAQLERQRLERQLQRMQRMESIGQLAGGIAHDFNNLLTVVQGASELLVAEDSADGRAELCNAIGQASQRGRNLTQHLLAVASRQHVVTERLELSRVVSDLQPVLKSMLGDSISLRIEVDSAAHVRAAITQIEQILLNLCGNARDALPRGGEVVISIASSGESVLLVVRDNGTGMAADVVERAFEPFFSTKGRGGSRGLGLATVYGISKQLNGQARLESVQGVGTTVTIELPRDSSVPEKQAVLVPSSPEARVEARVLLVEDEGAVRATVQRLLTQLGCSVRATADGESALALLRAEPDAVDVVLSDVVMPGLHGRPLLDAIRSVRPGLPIVFVSGYLDGRLTHRDLAEAGLEILPKPIERDRLAAALLRALARQAGTPTAHGGQ